MHILHNFTSSQLKAHLFDDQGGSSKTFLESILEPDSIVKGTDVDFFGREMLKQFGPALISHFSVFDDFLDPGIFFCLLFQSPPSLCDSCFSAQFSFLMKPTGKYHGRHAMVLVGVREENGEKYFLVQNWWREKQFVEVFLFGFL